RCPFGSSALTSSARTDLGQQGGHVLQPCDHVAGRAGGVAVDDVFEKGVWKILEEERDAVPTRLLLNTDEGRTNCEGNGGKPPVGHRRPPIWGVRHSHRTQHGRAAETKPETKRLASSLWQLTHKEISPGD